jgi:2-iminoacetate synthase
MSTFGSNYQSIDAEIRGILSSIRCPSPERVRELMLAAGEGVSLSLAELAELLETGAAPGADAQYAEVREAVVRRWRAPQGNRVRYVAPIYVSSYCIDQCAYCNFSALRQATVRKRLSVEELKGEIGSVMGREIRAIELVYATDPECTLDVLTSHVAAVAEALDGEPGSGVLLCTEYLSQQDYSALADAGLAAIVQWDETLERTAYEHWHASSPHKREFVRRMDNHDRAMAAGLDVATGVLFGLADYRYDALMQIAKGRHFEREYGRGPFVFGTARLKPIGGHELHLATEVSDRAYDTALLVYRLAMPQAGRWLQTRESFDTNLRNLLDGDVFTYRCGEVTPGGYQQIAAGSAVKGGQFGVNELEREYVEAQLASQGFTIDYRWMAPRAASVSTSAGSR